MELTLEEILDVKNIGKEFICLDNGSIVKNCDGNLLFSRKVEFTGQKIGNTIHLKRTKKEIEWDKALATMSWVKAKYKELIIE
jgi:archaellum component FlaG (FlaF/FlaG flagellin family)